MVQRDLHLLRHSREVQLEDYILCVGVCLCACVIYFTCYFASFFRIGCPIGHAPCFPTPRVPDQCRRLKTCSECLARHPKTFSSTGQVMEMWLKPFSSSVHSKHTVLSKSIGTNKSQFFCFCCTLKAFLFENKRWLWNDRFISWFVQLDMIFFLFFFGEQKY